MKRLVALLLIACGVAGGQTIASRRYAELNPTQYDFPSFQPIYSACNSGPNGTQIPLTCLQPTQFLYDQNTFASTANFTTILQTDASASFSVSGNVGTVTTTSTSGQTFIIASSSSSIPLPGIIGSLEITQNGSNSATDIIMVEFTNSDASDQLQCEYDTHAGQFNLAVYNGTSHTITTASIATPTAPWYMACTLVGATLSVWYGTSTSAMHLAAQGSATSYLNPRTISLSGWKTAFATYSSVATSWKVADLYTGFFGGVGMRDMNIVSYPDGRPYFQGSKLFFTATHAGPASDYSGNMMGLWSYDVVSQTLTPMSVFGQTGESNNCSGGICNNYAAHLLYDPQNNEERMVYSTWSSSTGLDPVVEYTTQSISTDDWLGAAQYHITPAPTAVTSPLAGSYPYAWDPGLTCAAWNYSTAACSLWDLSLTSCTAGATTCLPTELSSTSDPSANTWTTVFDDSSSSGWEGSRWARTATGSAGVAHYVNFGGTFQSYGLRSARSYLNGSYVTNLNAPFSGAEMYPSHPAMVSYAGNEYLLTFAQGYFGSNTYTCCRPAITSMPKYQTQTNWPIVAATDGVTASASAASITSDSLTVTNGDWVVVYCTGTGGSTPSSAAVSSSLSMGSFTNVGFSAYSGDTYQQVSYVKATAGGSSTFTCTPNVPSTYQSITTFVITPGFTSTIDYTGNANSASSAITYTSPTFSTTGPGIIVVCTSYPNTSNGYIPGMIGPFMAGQARGLDTGAGCETAITTAAQSGITATMGTFANIAQLWGGAIVSFK